MDDRLLWDIRMDDRLLWDIRIFSGGGIEKLRCLLTDLFFLSPFTY